MALVMHGLLIVEGWQWEMWWVDCTSVTVVGEKHLCWIYEDIMTFVISGTNEVVSLVVFFVWTGGSCGNVWCFI